LIPNTRLQSSRLSKCALEDFDPPGTFERLPKLLHPRQFKNEVGGLRA